MPSLSEASGEAKKSERDTHTCGRKRLSRDNLYSSWARPAPSHRNMLPSINLYAILTLNSSNTLLVRLRAHNTRARMTMIITMTMMVMVMMMMMMMMMTMIITMTMMVMVMMMMMMMMTMIIIITR